MQSYMKESHGDWLAVEHGSEVVRAFNLILDEFYNFPISDLHSKIFHNLFQKVGMKK